jgi:hypothetical protein
VIRTLDAQQLQAIGNVVVELTKLRQQHCNHLSVEHFASALFARMVYDATYPNRPDNL